jgi:hypothetical protein
MVTIKKKNNTALSKNNQNKTIDEILNTLYGRGNELGFLFLHLERHQVYLE